jgi:hypothetical protein
LQNLIIIFIKKEENISTKIIPESNVSNSNVLNKKSLFYARFQKVYNINKYDNFL